MKLKKQLTKQEKAIDKRWNKLWRKRHLTEAEEAEFGAIIRHTLRTRPDLFTQLPDGTWMLNEWMSKSEH